MGGTGLTSDATRHGRRSPVPSESRMFEPTRRRINPVPLVAIGLFILVIAFGVFQATKPLPGVIAATTLAPESVLGESRTVNMPAAGAANVSVTGLGLIATSGSDGSRPIASVTKMMTAYVILKSKPLEPGQPGPSITITSADQSRYLTMLNQDQSVMPVSAGQSFTQLELLQGLLIPSANNFGEILANWDAGSTAAFVTKMNAEARELGMTNTIYTDVSGFSSGTTSTPADQLILARAAMANPVFAQIVAMDEVRLPGIGLVDSTNMALGSDGVVGIKTGYTEEAGGNLAYAARRQAAGGEIEIIGMVFGQEDRPAAFTATRNIVNSIAQGVQSAQVITAGQPVAVLETKWDGTIDIVAAEDVTMMFWPGMTLQTTVILDSITAPSSSGTVVGRLLLTLGDQQREVPVMLNEDLELPGFFWRLGQF